MSALLELAARVEAASGADRESDGAVRQALFGDFGFCNGIDSFCNACSQPAHLLTQQPGCGAPLGMHDERKSYPSDWREDVRLPAYTASLDAAMSLVPEGCGWLRKDFQTMTVVRCGQGEKEWASHTDGAGATAALALCAAALRARAAIEGAGV